MRHGLDKRILCSFFKNSRANDIVLYASHQHCFIYGVLVPSRTVTPPNVKDLDDWNCGPSSSWGVAISYGKRSKVWLSSPLDHTGSKILDRGEKILFVRDFDGRQTKSLYWAFAETNSLVRFALCSERSAFCRFNERGDIEDIVRIQTAHSQSGDEECRVVTIRRGTLDEYMTITSQALVLLYDSTRFEPNEFPGWLNHECVYREVDPEIYYRIGRNIEQCTATWEVFRLSVHL